MNRIPSEIVSRARTEEGIRLGELALARGCVTPEQLERALEQQQQEPRRIGQILLEQRILTTRQCAELLLEQERLCPDRRHRRAGRFLLLHELGQGGSGVVWRAWDSQLARPVALKMLKVGDAREQEYLLREARMAAQLSHPNIISVYEILSHESSPCIAMELVEGPTLDGAAATRPLRQVLELVRDAARAVHYAHQKGVIHRDLKPPNLLVDPEGVVHVTDFGLAKETRPGSSLSETGMVAGTPAFMAPEQALGSREDIGPLSDVYGLGATLYSLAAGRLPFEGSSPAEVLLRVLHDRPPPLRRLRPDLPRDIETIVERAMEKNSVRRYPSAAALADDLDRYLNGQRIVARPVSLLSKGLFWARRHKAVSLLGVLLLLVPVWGWHLWRTDARRRRAVAHLEEARRALEEANRYLYREGANLDAMRTHVGRAETSVARSIEEDSSLPEAYFVRGQLRQFRGDAPGAEADYSRALELDPDFTTCRIRRALHQLTQRMLRLEMMLRLTQEPEAETAIEAHDVAEELDRALRSGKAGSEEDLAYARVALLIARREYEEARRACDGFLEKLETEDLRHLHGFVLHQLGDFPGALRTLERAVQIKPYDAVARRAIVHLLIHGQRWREALPHMDVVCAIFSDRAEPWSTRGWLHHRVEEYDQARTDLDRAIEIDPTDARARFDRGYSILRLGRPEEALADLERAICLWEATGSAREIAAARVTRAEALAAIGRTAEALEELDRAERQRPGWASTAQMRGVVYLGMGDRKRAAGEFEEATRRDPRLLVAWYNLATFHREEGDWAKADAEFTRALEIEPTDLEARLGRARCRLSLGRPAEALVDFDEALPRSSKDPLPFVGRAAARRHLRDSAGAAKDLEEAFRRDSDCVEALLERAILAGESREWASMERDAERALARVRERPRDLSIGLMLRGTARARLGRIREGTDDLAEAIRVDPKNAQAYFNRGMLLESAEDFRRATELQPRWAQAWYMRGVLASDLEEAETAFLRAVEADPNLAEGWLNLGTTRHGRKQYREAIDAYARALSAKPDWALALANRATTWMQLEVFREAESDARRAIAAEEGFPLAHELLGFALVRQGDEEGAVRAFTCALEIEPARVKCRYQRGKLLAKLGRNQDALEDLERAVREHPGLKTELQPLIDALRNP